MLGIFLYFYLPSSIYFGEVSVQIFLFVFSCVFFLLHIIKCSEVFMNSRFKSFNKYILQLFSSSLWLAFFLNQVFKKVFIY